MIRINLSAPNLKITDQLTNLVEEKLANQLNKYLKPFNIELATANVLVTTDKIGSFIVTFDMQLASHPIYAKVSHAKLESALVDLQQQVEKQIKKFKQDLSSTSLS